MAVCNIPGCSAEAVARGLCMRHYKQSRRNNCINIKEKPVVCQYPGCSGVVYSKGLCRKHYNQDYYKRRTEK